jgi:hypothetical protein
MKGSISRANSSLFNLFPDVVLFQLLQLNPVDRPCQKYDVSILWRGCPSNKAPRDERRTGLEQVKQRESRGWWQPHEPIEAHAILVLAQ